MVLDCRDLPRRRGWRCIIQTKSFGLKGVGLRNMQQETEGDSGGNAQPSKSVDPPLEPSLIAVMHLGETLPEGQYLLPNAGWLVTVQDDPAHEVGDLRHLRRAQAPARDLLQTEPEAAHLSRGIPRRDEVAQDTTRRLRGASLRCRR